MAVDDALSVLPPQALKNSALDLATLAAGRVVEARVVSIVGGIAVLAGRFGTAEADLSALGAGKAAVGDVLRLEVRAIASGDGSSKLGFAVVEKTAATAEPATSAGVGVDGRGTVAAALAQAVRSAVSTQSGLAPLYASLAGLASAAPGSVPDSVRTMAAQMMEGRLATAGPPTATEVAKAFTGSGLFLESGLAKGAGVAARDDLKAGLIALRAVLRDWVGGAGPESTVAAGATGGAATAGAVDPPARPAGATTSATGAGGDAIARVASAAYGAGRGAGAAAHVSLPTAGAAGAARTVDPAAVGGPATTAAVATAVVATGVAVTVAAGSVAAPAGATTIPAAAMPQTSSETATTTAAAVATAGVAAPGGVGLAGVTVPAAGVGVAAPPVGTMPAPGAAIAAEGEAPGGLAATVLAAVTTGSSTGAAATAAGALAGAATVTASDRGPRPPPPRRGQAPRGQAALPAESVGEGASATALGRRALERTEGALQRIMLGQYAVLDRPADEGIRGVDAVARREWTAEMPLATPTGTGVVQMTVERDGRQGGDPARPATEGWRVRFSLDVEPIGPVHAQIGLSGERLSIGLWVERPEMAARFGAELGQLRGALEAAAIPVEGVHVAVGRPVEPKPKASSHFVDVSL